MADRNEELTILATTLFAKTRCCVAGIDSRGSWVRPGVEGARLGTYAAARLLLPSYLWPGNQFVGGSLSVVETRLNRNVHKSPPHIEDAELLEPFRYRDQIMKEKDRIHYLEDHSENAAIPDASDENEMAERLAGLGRSLILVGPLTIQKASFGVWSGRYGEESYRTRITFKLPRQKGVMDLSCTDLRWRAVGRALGAEKSRVTINGEDLSTRLSVRPDQTYLAIGLTRGDADHRNYAIAIGVHTVPDYVALDVDGRALPIHVRQNHL